MRIAAHQVAQLYAHQPKRNKYGARKTVVNGLNFQSRKEADRWLQLLWLETTGQIQNLKRQVRYPLRIDGKLTGHYIADFVYDEGANKEIVEDAKGMKTQLFNFKIKVFKALYPQSEVRIT